VADLAILGAPEGLAEFHWTMSGAVGKRRSNVQGVILGAEIVTGTGFQSGTDRQNGIGRLSGSAEAAIAIGNGSQNGTEIVEEETKIATTTVDLSDPSDGVRATEAIANAVIEMTIETIKIESRRKRKNRMAKRTTWKRIIELFYNFLTVLTLGSMGVRF